MLVLLCKNDKKSRTKETLPLILDEFTKLNIDVTEDLQNAAICDFIVTIGGDGTILKWGKIAALNDKPLVGINTGRLGFMATLECNELLKLGKLISGDYRISRRMMLNIKVRDENHLAINDIVFAKSTYSKLPEFHVKSMGVEVSKIRADGIIFSTATGSTAYSLSAGGPIIEPELECIEFTPLAAHSLFGRSMLFTGNNAVEIIYTGYETSEVKMSIDGDEGFIIKENEVVEITKSSHKLKLIDFEWNSFYNAVHNKLMQPLK